MERDDELRRHLGTLWRTAMVGIGTVREVVVRSTQAGRLRVDIALLQRERAQLLETLGESMLLLIDRGELSESGELPESVRQLCDRIHDVQDRLKSDTARAVDNAFGAPRGFEPEAAADYGTEYGDAHDLHDDDGAGASSSDTDRISASSRGAGINGESSRSAAAAAPMRSTAGSTSAATGSRKPRKKSTTRRKSSTHTK